MNIKITGTGSYIPDYIETNENFLNHEFLNSDGSQINAPSEVIVKKFKGAKIKIYPYTQPISNIAWGCLVLIFFFYI